MGNAIASEASLAAAINRKPSCRGNPKTSKAFPLEATGRLPVKRCNAASSATSLAAATSRTVCRLLGQLPEQLRPFSPTNARTGEISVTLSVTKPNSVTTPFSILGVPFASNTRHLPIEARIQLLNFLLTASICFSAGRAATSFIHCWKAGSVGVGTLACRTRRRRISSRTRRAEASYLQSMPIDVEALHLADHVHPLGDFLGREANCRQGHPFQR